jgi:2-polyprenyl-6-methoxyphenol hydroxylase-like FAD-dependent oxidoreductase
MLPTRVLISGAGIAGPTLAHWLLRHGGFEVTLLETAPQLRTGGYVVDFWGAGYDIAERMGILPELQEMGYRVREVRMVNREGKRVGHFPVDALRRVQHGRLLSLSRAGLASAIYATLRGKLETLFGDSVASLEQHPDRVEVRFEHAPPRAFDLVIGADGVHSRVRSLAFGEDRLERYLGMQFAAFELSGYRPQDENVYAAAHPRPLA